MAKSAKVAVYGLGSVGRDLCEVLLDKDAFELRGAVDINPEMVGEDVGTVVGRDAVGIEVTDSHDDLHAAEDIDVSLVTTTSFFEGVKPLVEECIRAGTDVVSTSEELFFPTPEHEEGAAEIDALAKEHGVTVVSGGMNPGLVFDVLPVTLSGVCIDVDHIKATRFANLSPYDTAQSRFGAGLPLEEYRTQLTNGEIQTHVGMEESLRMVESALGIEYDDIYELQEPIIASERRETPYIEIPAGTVAGIRQKAYGIIDDVAFVSIEVTVEAIDVNEETSHKDEIHISGTPDIDLAVEPSFQSIEGTIGRTINTVPRAMQADPGYKSLKDLPLIGATIGDFESLME
jgi:4-hydroxy-tetrahydrodipicolinate reductase